MKPQITGASRWSVWRLKMWSCHISCREPWLLRLRLHERPEPRSAHKPHNAWFKNTLYAILTPLSLLPHVGDCSWRWDECIPCSEGGVPCDRRVPVGPTAPLPADPEHHCSWEELHHHLPSAFGCPVSFLEEVNPDSTDKLRPMIETNI